MFRNKYETGRLFSIQRECVAFIVASLAIFILCALYFYCPYDASLFYYTSSNDNCLSNPCGSMGAHIAALFIYLFGSASCVVSGLLFFVAYCLFFNYSWKQEWERFVALSTLICALSALLAFHSIDFLYSVEPGGYIGMYLYGYLYQLFGRFGAALFIYMCLYACVIIVSRCSFMRIGYFAAHFVFILYRWFDRYQIAQRAVWAVWISLVYVVKAMQVSVQCIKDILTGVIFFDTGLMVPEQSTDAYNIVDENNFSMNEDISDVEPTDILKQNSFGQEQKIIVTPTIRTTELEGQPENQPVSVALMKTFEEQSDVQEIKKQYRLPDLDIFVGVENERNDHQLKNELEERAITLQEKLQRFGIMGTVVSIKRGPVVTLFEYKPDIDTKLSKILALEDDLVMALRAHSIRILAPIPGKSVVGFEVANVKRIDVLLADTIKSTLYTETKATLPLVLGKDTIGNQVIVDLARMPHLLIAGSTGSGKSVALNVMLVSLLCARSPKQLKLILIDPKRLEFAAYVDIGHLLFPIVVDMKKVAPVLRWVVQHMEARYEQMAAAGARNIFDYNDLVSKGRAHEQMPFIVVMIDELADLMMTVGKEVEDLITRITQMARAAGIHMLVATQRPSVDVITGLIKVNFPSRISFRVTSRVDSRTILDCGGADKLLGRGDMLFLDSTTSTLNRVHGAYVSDGEIEKLVAHIKDECVVEYLDLTQELQQEADALDEGEQQLYEQVIEFLQEIDSVSISLLQRKFKIGYNRSARMIDMLESHGLIMPASGSKTRRVIKY